MQKFIKYNRIVHNESGDSMIKNKIVTLEEGIIKVPVIVRSPKGDWMPAFEMWETKVKEGDLAILRTQSFRKNIKDFDTESVTNEIGYFKGEDLYVKWITLINKKSLQTVNEYYSGYLTACSWQRRYCVYFGAGSNTKWLHSIVSDKISPDYVDHHINGVSLDNRNTNLHNLKKIDHDSINHPGVEERKIMFKDPDLYWKTKKEELMEEFTHIIRFLHTEEGIRDFIENFGVANLALTKELLKRSQRNLNLAGLVEKTAESRILNPQLSDDYLSSYEMEKYIKKLRMKKNTSQLKIF